MEYKPGLHILTTVYSPRTDLLQHSIDWKLFISEQITRNQLTEVGQIVHDFPGGGFTAVHCLTESHVSIHTWPEYGLCTCDVFLSNFRNNNDDITESILQHILRFFEASHHDTHTIRR